MKRFLLFAVAVLALVGCNNAFEDEHSARLEQNVLPTLTAGFGDATRTYVEQDTYLRWHTDDRLTIFYGNTLNLQYKFNGNTGDNSGSFTHVPSGNIETGNSFDHIYAVYPYDANISLDDINKSISLTLPAEQEYAEESFGKDANTMIAVTENLEDTFLGFKNACGYLKIKLYGDATVKSIKLKGNNGEKIAGAATITMAYGETPQLTMATDATKSITLNCGEGVALSNNANNPTEFWFVVPPTTFNKGITVTATNLYGLTFEQSTSNKVVVERNQIQPMAAVAVEFEEVAKPANNKIWYTSSGGEIVKPYSGPDNDYADAITTFGANIVSNNYKDGKGVITFDGDVTTIGERAFTDCGLTSVTIPDSVTTIGDYAFFFCTSLTNVIIPDSITTIGYGAFYCCRSLTSVFCKATTPPSLGYVAFKYYDYFYDIDINIGCTIYVPRGCGSAYKSASNWRGYAADIVEYDFETWEVGPEGQHNNEIWYTSSDSEIVKPRTNVFGTNIVSNNYKDGKGIITFDGNVTMIGERAFEYCLSLTSVTIPDSVATIGYMAFHNCYSLTSVTIPDNVTTIGTEAFCYCNSLKEFKGKFAADNGRCLIVDGVLNSFAIGCGATDYTIPDSVTTIGHSAFYNCDSLTSVTIGDSVTTIGERAFYSCDSLTSVYCKATTPPSLGDYAFKYSSNWSYINIGCTIYVPRGCGEAYKSVPDWNDYAADIVEYDF